MEGTNAFGAFFAELRRRAGVSLREFCRTNGFDPGNTSKLERGVLSPPQSSEILQKYAEALGLSKGTDDWIRFFDFAAIGTGMIPSDIVADEHLMKAIPLLFRSVRCRNLTEEDVHRLVEDIREQLE